MLPSHNKQWNFEVNNKINLLFDVNNQYSSDIVFNRNVFYQIKNYLKNNGWTVVYSSNGVSSPSTTEDRWSSLDSILITNSGSAAYPWIILKNDSISTNFSISISCSGGIRVAPSGFLLTGGTPSSISGTVIANDLISVSSNITIISNSLNFPNAILHCMSSSDNLSYRFIVCIGSSIAMSFFIEKSTTTLDSNQWSVPFIWMYNGIFSTRFLINESVRTLTAAVDSSYKEKNSAPTDYYQAGYDDFYDQVILYPYGVVYKSQINSPPQTTYVNSSLHDTYLINPTYNYIGNTLSDNINQNKFAIIPIASNFYTDFSSLPYLNLVIPWNGSFMRIY